MNKLAQELLTKFHEQSNTLKHKNVWSVYILELSLIPILVTMEHKGLQVDSDNMNTLDRVMSVSVPLYNNHIVATPVKLQFNVSWSHTYTKHCCSTSFILIIKCLLFIRNSNLRIYSRGTLFLLLYNFNNGYGYCLNPHISLFHNSNMI